MNTNSTSSIRIRRGLLRTAATAGVIAAGFTFGCDDANDNGVAERDRTPAAPVDPAPSTPAPSTTTPHTPTQPAPTTPGAPPAGAASAAVSAEARILSILHVKNREEVEAGTLAKENGGSNAVREFGDVLVRDHTSNNELVTQTARDANITLMSDDEVRRMLARETGQASAPADPLAELRGLSGAEFDRAFARVMRAGHHDLITRVEAAEKTVSDGRVKDVLTRTLPVLRDHHARLDALTAPPG